MKRSLLGDAFSAWVGLLALITCLGPGVRASDDMEKLQREVPQAIQAFEKDDSTLKELFANSAGYAIFPRVSKGGLVFGGAHGVGLVYEKGALIGRAELSQATFGAQIGGQAFREVIFFETPAALDRFKESKFEMSAQVGAVAAAEGAGKNAKYHESVLVFTKVLSGLMAEASIGGQKFKFTPVKP
ncbi:MAG: lipid-binding SYLF domain-containing protein [Verrucomicrobiales bacterium]|nr:lipid-binding SYLF domain-containing protein [Verrucomicrobiales bacterium]